MTLDKKAVRRAFDSAVEHYDSGAILQKQVLQELFSRLVYLKMAPQTILDLGCGTGKASVKLANTYPKADIISMDIAFKMLQKTRHQFEKNLSLIFLRYLKIRRPLQTYLQADMDFLPLGNSKIDFIWSNLSLQWSNNLQQVFQEMNRILTPDGGLLLSIFGSQTLQELRSILPETYIHPFFDIQQIGGFLVKSGFTDPVLDTESITMTYESAFDVLKDLKNIGAGNALINRHKGLSGKHFLQKISHNYEIFRQVDGRFPATFEVIYIQAWKKQKTPPSEFSPLVFAKKKI